MKITPLIRSSWSAMSALWVAGLLLAPVGTAASPLVRTVSGDVEAVNLAAAPQVIVVKVILPTKEDLIVGATVGADVAITRGKEQASLADVKAGDRVRITYEKRADGIAARAIHVR